MDDVDRQWRKSSYSEPNGGQCVEVAQGGIDAIIRVRDSKDPTGPMLAVSVGAWREFTASLKS